MVQTARRLRALPACPLCRGRAWDDACTEGPRAWTGASALPGGRFYIVRLPCQRLAPRRMCRQSVCMSATLRGFALPQLRSCVLFWMQHAILVPIPFPVSRVGGALPSEPCSGPSRHLYCTTYLPACLIHDRCPVQALGAQGPWLAPSSRPTLPASCKLSPRMIPPRPGVGEWFAAGGLALDPLSTLWARRAYRCLDITKVASGMAPFVKCHEPPLSRDSASSLPFPVPSAILFFSSTV